MLEKAVFIRRGKAVGHVKGDVFYKKLSSSKHFLRKPPSISFDEKSLKKAFNYGAKRIVIYDKDTKKIISPILRRFTKKDLKSIGDLANRLPYRYLFGM